MLFHILTYEQTVARDPRSVVSLDLPQILYRDGSSSSDSYSHEYSRISIDEGSAVPNNSAITLQNCSSTESEGIIETPISNETSSWSDIRTKRVMSTLLTQAIFDFHIRYAIRTFFVFATISLLEF